MISRMCVSWAGSAPTELLCNHCTNEYHASITAEKRWEYPPAVRLDSQQDIFTAVLVSLAKKYEDKKLPGTNSHKGIRGSFGVPWWVVLSTTPPPPEYLDKAGKMQFSLFRGLVVVYINQTAVKLIKLRRGKA